MTNQFVVGDGRWLLLDEPKLGLGDGTWGEVISNDEEVGSLVAMVITICKN